jgi:hypothetical protein
MRRLLPGSRNLAFDRTPESHFMMSDTSFGSTRRFALGEVKRLLGILDPSADKLFSKARTVLGADRANRCLELARLAPLTRRWVPASAIASLIVGTLDLGPEWWTRQHEELTADRLWEVRGTPDGLLDAGHGDEEREDSGSCLALLGGWIADDAADKEWGRPVDRVDMSDPRVDGRVTLPEGVSVGDRLTAIFAPGGRVWVEVVEGPSRPGSRLAERRYHEVAEARSAWSMATATGPIRLPGETAGRASDPFADAIDHDASRRLFDWAKTQGVTATQLTGPWRTKEALWSARHRLGLPYSRPGEWFTFDDAVAAAIDGDRAELMSALADLEG